MSDFFSSYLLHRLSPTLLSFATDQASIYEVNFAPFEKIAIVARDELIEIENFQLVVYRVSGTEASADTKIGVTVCYAINTFFEEDDTRILSYICDSIDDRQAARKRRFDQWYSWFGPQHNINKVDTIITVDGNEYLISLLVSKNHPYQFAIEEEFFRSASSFNK